MHINKSQKGNKNDKAWWQPALIMFARMSGWIAVPVIIGAFLGKWLDEKYNSEPWFFLITVGVSFIISMFGLAKVTIEEYKKINKKSTGQGEKKDGNNQIKAKLK